MKDITKILLIYFLFSLLNSCKTEDLILKKLDGIQSTKYYQTDVIPPAYQSIYGIWRFSKTSGGFINGVIKPDFDYLLLKPNAIFGIIRNDSLIAYGKLTLLPDNPLIYINSLLCKFEFDQNAKIELNGDSEKYISLVNNDSLDLNAPCCDRINAHFIRQYPDILNLTNPGTLKGKISIGPLCPVETIPPQPGCTATADTYKAWQTAIWNSTKTQKLIDIIPNIDGTFEINLSEGQYVIDLVNTNNRFGGGSLPMKFTINHLKTTQLDINIDTGIR
jgi:hypothetical protein